MIAIKMKPTQTKYCRLTAFLLTLFLFSISSAVIPDSHAETGKDTAAAPMVEAVMQQALKAFNDGHFADAVKCWQDAVSIYASHEKNSALVEAMHILRGDLNAARQYFETGLEIAAEEPLPEIKAGLFLSMGNLAVLENKPDDAIKYYNISKKLADQAGNSILAAKTRINIARIYSKREHNGDAIPLLESAFKSLQKVPQSHDKAYNLIAVGRLYARIHSTASEETENDLLRQAYLTFQAASETAASIKDPRAASYALGYMGNLYETQERFQDALQLTHQAIAALQKIRAPEIIFRWQWQVGRLLADMDDNPRAIAAYRRAVGSLDELRNEFTRSFRQLAEPIYLELTDLLLQHSAALDDDEPIQKALLAARTIMDQLKVAELQDYFQEYCVIALKTKETSLETVLKNTATAAVYPIQFPERLELLVSFPDRLKRYTLSVSADELKKTADSLRTLLEQPDTRLYRKPARQLYDWLVRPLENDLHQKGIKTLLFAPDGPLRTIPMAALYDRKQKQFLIQQYAVVTTPGLTLIAPRKLPRDNMRISLNGLTQAVQGFPPLPHIGQEMDAVKNLYDSAVLKDKAFTIEKLAQTYQKSPYTVIHIASHGKFHSNPEKTYLLTYDSKLTMDDLQRIIEQGRFREKAVELLTLSACQTAVGDERAALGLAGAGVKAGARTVLASLWFINDESAAKLVTTFYEQLKDRSLSRAQALQNAQLKQLKDRRFRHPAYWAAFLLIGNWL
ncbi:CHAT domain-containing protein [Desulfococcaceae bacterium HSG9]|nr:CHAT domain-containing protein [Desulfococcaceae bacterium HSG9]